MSFEDPGYGVSKIQLKWADQGMNENTEDATKPISILTQEDLEKRRNGLSICASWLDLCCKEETQSRRSRQYLVFTTITASVALVTFLSSGPYMKEAILSFPILVGSAVIFNHRYHRKVTTWKMTAEWVAKIQKDLMDETKFHRAIRKLEKYTPQERYRRIRRNIDLLYMDVPSVVLYTVLIYLIVGFSFRIYDLVDSAFLKNIAG